MNCQTCHVIVDEWKTNLMSLAILFHLLCAQHAKRTPPNISHSKNSNTQWTENKTTDVVIHQHSRRLLKMDILMSETCWVHNKWNKIASDIKFGFSFVNYCSDARSNKHLIQTSNRWLRVWGTKINFEIMKLKTLTFFSPYLHLHIQTNLSHFPHSMTLPSFLRIS